MFNDTSTHTWKCCCHRWRQQSCTNIFTRKHHWKYRIVVTLVLLLTAAGDQKINLASKLIYLFLSLALLLIFHILQIGCSYKPEKCTFLQPTLSNVLKKTLKCIVGLFAGTFIFSSVFLCNMFLMLINLFKTAKANSLGVVVITFSLKDTLLMGSLSSAK